MRFLLADGGAQTAVLSATAKKTEVGGSASAAADDCLRRGLRGGQTGGLGGQRVLRRQRPGRLFERWRAETDQFAKK